LAFPAQKNSEPQAWNFLPGLPWRFVNFYGKNFAMPFSRALPINSEFFFAEAVPLTG
jgi:hypothetical protein